MSRHKSQASNMDYRDVCYNIFYFVCENIMYKYACFYFWASYVHFLLDKLCPLYGQQVFKKVNKHIYICSYFSFLSYIDLILSTINVIISIIIKTD